MAGTGDYGEDNGTADISPGLKKITEVSPAKLFREMPQVQVNRLDVWMDAGIRDFINSAQITNALFSEMQLRLDDSRVFNDFTSLPGIPEVKATLTSRPITRGTPWDKTATFATATPRCAPRAMKSWVKPRGAEHREPVVHPLFLFECPHST